MRVMYPDVERLKDHFQCQLDKQGIVRALGDGAKRIQGFGRTEEEAWEDAWRTVREVVVNINQLELLFSNQYFIEQTEASRYAQELGEVEWILSLVLLTD